MKKQAQRRAQIKNEPEELRKSQQFNQLIFENAPDLIAIQKLEDLSYEYVNPKTLSVLGYSEEELLRKSAVEFIHPDDVVRVLTAIKENLAKGEGRADLRYRKKNGSYIWLEVTATPIPGETENPSLIVISRDITDRKETEEALQTSEAKLRRILESSPDALSITDLDATIIDCNPAEEALRNAHDELEMKVLKRTAQLKKTNEELKSEIIVRKRTEKALKESENYYRTMFENTGTATMIVDIDLKISRANVIFSKQSGYSQDDLVGRNMFEFVVPQDLALVQENYRLRKLDPSKAPPSYEIKALNKYGEIRDCIINVSSVPSSEYLVVSLLDVTEQRQAESRMKASEERFRALFEQAPLGIAINRNGHNLFSNPAYVDMFGYDSSDELIGTAVINQIAPGSRQEVRKKTNKLPTGEVLPVSHESVGLRKDGSTFPIYVQVINIELPSGPANASFVADITESRNAQELRDKYIMLSTTSRDIILYIRQSDGRIIEANEAAVKEYGYSRAELLGMTIYDLRKQDKSQLVDGQMRQASKGGIMFEAFHFRKDGSVFPVEVSSRGTTIDGDSVLLSIIRNITARRQVEERLLSSEKKYRTIFENTGAATIVVDADMTILQANQEWERVLGYKKKELEGTKWTEYFNGVMVELMKEYHHLRRIDPKSAPAMYMTRLKDHAGKMRDGLLYVDAIPDTTQSVATFIDLTDYQRLDRVLKGIVAGNSAMIQAANEQDLLDGICRKIVEVGGYSLAWVGYLQDDQLKKVKPIAHDGKNDGYLSKLNIALKDSKRGLGPVARAIRTGQPVVLKDFKKDETFMPWAKDALKRGFKSTMAIPLMADNKAFGALSIYASENDVFDNGEQTMLIEMANNLAYAIMAQRTRTEKNQTEEELKISLEKMQRILMQSVTSLGNTLEIRDPYTAGHQRRVTNLATAIAKELAFSPDQIEGIAVAGNLHDIGKINVPSEILSKPGKISAMEFGIIKTHCQAGYEIVKDIEFPWPVAEVLLQHHERMNGSGYPRGLAGEEILMEARIMAVADVVEAMASHRPYRPALGVDTALEEIVQNRGILYDPDVVDACLKLFHKQGFNLE